MFTQNRVFTVKRVYVRTDALLCVSAAEDARRVECVQDGGDERS